MNGICLGLWINNLRRLNHHEKRRVNEGKSKIFHYFQGIKWGR